MKTTLTVTHAGMMNLVAGTYVCNLVGFSVRRDGREISRHESREAAYDQAVRVHAFLSDQGESVELVGLEG